MLAALDGGGAVFQRRLRDVLVGSTVILVPSIALNVWLSVLLFDRLDPSSDLSDVLATTDGIENVGRVLGALSVSLVTAVVGYYCARLLIGDRFGTPITMWRALLHTAKKLPSITAAWLMTHWWHVLAVWILAATDDEGSVVGLLVLYAFVAWFCAAATVLVIPVMVSEGLGPFAAAKRSWRLTRLGYGTCVVFVLVATLLASLLLLGISTLVPVLNSLGFVTFGDANGIVQGVMAQMAVLVVMPLIALGTAQLYVEMRVAREGLDLVMDAHAAFGAPE